jgi:hypothetical protein
MNQIYLDTARLLTQVAPLVITDGTFALKGGTAINLFIRDMPRLSVDLDLVFPDYSLPRDQTLARIGDAIRHAAERLQARGFQTHTIASADAPQRVMCCWPIWRFRWYRWRTCSVASWSQPWTGSIPAPCST